MRMPLHERLYNWLSPADGPGQSDLIFVLAGRQSRKLYALELFRQALGGTLLMSVGRFEIRKFAQLPIPADVDLLQIASTTPPLATLFRALSERYWRGGAGTTRAFWHP